MKKTTFRRCAARAVTLLTLAAAATVPAMHRASAQGLPSPHPLEGLAAAAESFVRAQLGTQARADTTLFVRADAPDPRLRLAQCPQPPEAFLSAGARLAARTTIGLRCAQPAWTVYVTVATETEMPVLVLRNAAARGAKLQATDVELQRRRVPGFASGYVTRPEELAGRHLRTASAPGTALTADLLAADVLVKRGQRVTLVAAAGGIEVRAQGEAVSDASAAGRVRVQNLASRKVVEGQVETADRVRVSP